MTLMKTITPYTISKLNKEEITSLDIDSIETAQYAVLLIDDTDIDNCIAVETSISQCERVISAMISDAEDFADQVILDTEDIDDDDCDYDYDYNYNDTIDVMLSDNDMPSYDM